MDEPIGACSVKERTTQQLVFRGFLASVRDHYDHCLGTRSAIDSSLSSDIRYEESAISATCEAKSARAVREYQL